MRPDKMTDKSLVIDLDKTLALLPDGSRDFMNAELNLPLLSELMAARAKGYKLKLVTARGDRRRNGQPFSTVMAEVEQEIMGWLRIHNLEHFFDEIQIGLKPYAELYIDDKGIPPEAFVGGITTAKQWSKLIKSKSFANLVEAHAKPSRIYLTLRNNGL